ncbi:unnamed protein product [Blepharisma stoltei]|uniref:Septin-type G domain-containing protein n=1 Tax=Blepharisma stoltei TaxID=1481888 RepID=A0AAU9J451_9CILI|nr:unnamed protein product [Blepharisma stoltei]
MMSGKRNLTRENLEQVLNLPEEESIMAKFLRDNQIHNIAELQEIQENMPLAMMYYNQEEQSEPYLFRKISSTSTVKSVYFDSSNTNSSPSSLSSDTLDHDMNILLSLGLEGRVHFNIMLAGDSGLGKSTFIQTYLALKFFDISSSIFHEDKGIYPATKDITHNQAVKTLDNLTLLVDMVDTPGYGGDFKDIKAWINYIERFLITQIKLFYKRNSSNPETIKDDTRIHLCMYFVEGPKLKENDIYALKILQKYVNVIPILAKADICTIEEIKRFKKNIIKQAQYEDIVFFDCVSCLGSLKDELFSGPLGLSPPFAIISGITLVELNERCIYGRQYPWGIADMNNPRHCDYLLFNRFLIGYFLQSAIKSTKILSDRVFLEQSQLKKQKKESAKQQKLASRIGKAAIFPLAAAALIGYFSLKKRM